jgi:hypothetical protein
MALRFQRFEHETVRPGKRPWVAWISPGDKCDVQLVPPDPIGSATHLLPGRAELSNQASSHLASLQALISDRYKLSSRTATISRPAWLIDKNTTKVPKGRLKLARDVVLGR